jgi:hypothetical protein
MLLGALLFEPIRERILGKPELRWCDHLTLTVTDPLGAANSVLERSLGIQTDIRVQFFLPGLAPHAQFADHTARSRNRRQEHHYRSPGVGIEFVFAGAYDLRVDYRQPPVPPLSAADAAWAAALQGSPGERAPRDER